MKNPFGLLVLRFLAHFMENTVPSLSMRRTAAEMLALVIRDFFPQAILVGSHVSAYGFAYDFLNIPPLAPGFFSLIEQKLHQMKKESLPIQHKEMMRENASEYLKHLGCPIRAWQIRQEPVNIVSLFFIDSFIDPCPGPFLANTGEVGVIRLLETEDVLISVEEEVRQGIRIHAVVFPDVGEVKKFFKRWKEAKKRDPILLGTKKELFVQTKRGERVWLEKGIEWKRYFQSIWEEKYPFPVWRSVQTSLVRLAAQRPFSAQLCINPLPAFVQLFQGEILRVKEWKSVCTEEREELQAVVCLMGAAWEAEEELISFLQFIEKISTMFGFRMQWILSPCRAPRSAEEKRKMEGIRKRILSIFDAAFLSYEERRGDRGEEFQASGVLVQALLFDFLGREVFGPWIHWVIETEQQPLPGEEGEEVSVLLSSAFGSMDRWMDLFLERWEGVFPGMP